MIKCKKAPKKKCRFVAEKGQARTGLNPMKLEPYKQKIDQILEETVLFSDDSWVLKDCKKENAIGGCRDRAGCIWPGFGTLFRGGTVRDPDNSLSSMSITGYRSC